MAQKITIPTEKIVAWLKNLPTEIADFFGDLPDTIMGAPTDEKIAYGAIVLGLILLIVGIAI